MSTREELIFLYKRWLGAFGLLVASYNPTGWSYLGWVDHRPYLPLSIVLLVGFALCAGFVFYIRGAVRTFGATGVVLLYVFFGLTLWALNDYQIVTLDDHNVLVWLLLIVTSMVFSIGISWTKLRRMSITNRRSKQMLNDDW